MQKPILKITDLIKFTDAIIVDARGGTDAFERFMKGHLPGAHFVDLETQLSKKSEDAKNGGRHPLPAPQEFAQLLSRLGINNASTVIIYDDKNGANAAARFWWMMSAAGHESAYVIDGGLQAMMKAGIKLSTENTVASKPTTYTFKEWTRPISTMNEVKTSSKLVIDVREAYRYNGESEPIDLIAGHIPEAINVPYIENLTRDGEFLPANELHEKYKKVIGNKEPSEVIVHCGSGVTACHTLLAMEQGGISGASLYVGSWSEWSRNDNPMITQTTS